MLSYAILGATGQTGSSILQTLLQDTDKIAAGSIHCFVRSREKLLAQQPDLASNPAVEIFTGSVTEPANLIPCIAKTSVIFACMATNDNAPGTSIALDTAHTLVAAFIRIRNEDPKAPLPTIVVLSSSSLSDHLSRKLLPFVHGMLLRAAGHVYDDLRRAEAYYRLHTDWMRVVFVQPGGLVNDEPKGHKISQDMQQTPLSYLDLAAGMIEIGNAAAEHGSYVWEGVCVVPAKEGTRFPKMIPVVLVMGLSFYYIPSLYGISKWLNII